MAEPIDARTKRNLLILVAAQGFIGAQMPIIFIVAGLAGQSLVSNPCWATLPITCIVVGSMLAASPLSLFMQHFADFPYL
ncbi:MAG TPA: MFS transporter, partial [Rhodobacter sp.]|nr:MFS transporter [Rhodobacter sp.]